MLPCTNKWTAVLTWLVLGAAVSLVDSEAEGHSESFSVAKLQNNPQINWTICFKKHALHRPGCTKL